MIDGMKVANKLKYVTSECFDEPLGQSLDLYYTWNDWKEHEAPLLGAVYGGYLQWYGSGNGGGIDEAARLARTVFWGGRIGIYASADMAIGNERIRGLVERLVSLQRRTHPYLTYGEMVRPPRWQGNEPRRLLIPATANKPAVYIEGVERAAWKAPDDRVGVCLVSYLTEPLEATFDLGSLKGLVPAEKPNVIGPAGVGPIAASRDGQLLRVTLPPVVPVLVEIGQE